jgi:hypothetical protein
MIIGIVFLDHCIEALHDDNDFLVFFFALPEAQIAGVLCGRLAGLRFHSGRTVLYYCFESKDFAKNSQIPHCTELDC